MEGYLFGCPSFALLSGKESGWSYLGTAPCALLEIIVGDYIKNPLKSPFLLNVNIPNMYFEELSGVIVTRLGRRHSAQPVVEQINPRGKKIYWMGPAGCKDNVYGTDFWAVDHVATSV